MSRESFEHESNLILIDNISDEYPTVEKHEKASSAHTGQLTLP
jgi:hypothetical protein